MEKKEKNQCLAISPRKETISVMLANYLFSIYTNRPVNIYIFKQ